LQQQILSAIRAGAYAHVAAQAFGIPPEVLADWLGRGDAGRRGKYTDFAAELRQAEAQARVRAECEAFREQPTLWLRHGPGRERAGVLGWTSPVRSVASDAADPNVWCSPSFLRLVRGCLETLKDRPDIRVALAEQLDQVAASPTASPPRRRAA